MSKNLELTSPFDPPIMGFRTLSTRTSVPTHRCCKPPNPWGIKSRRICSTEEYCLRSQHVEGSKNLKRRIFPHQKFDSFRRYLFCLNWNKTFRIYRFKWWIPSIRRLGYLQKVYSSAPRLWMSRPGGIIHNTRGHLKEKNSHHQSSKNFTTKHNKTILMVRARFPRSNLLPSGEDCAIIVPSFTIDLQISDPN